MNETGPDSHAAADELSPYAHDEALLAAVRADGAPAVSVHRPPGPAVVLGRGGRLELEVHADRVLADGVPLLRRRGGGCAVVLDPGNVVVSLAMPLAGIGGITTAFRLASAWVAAQLERCGVSDVRQEGVSDLAVGDRKLGGSCIWRTRGLLHYSTTVLVAPDLALIDRYLPHPPREPAYRRGRPHRDFLTSVTAAASTPGAPVRAAEFAVQLETVVRADLPALLHLLNGGVLHDTRRTTRS
ncbi:MAG: hypothetical protein R6X25_06615 [Candidatus Krumholzibacteriia bacterium]